MSIRERIQRVKHLQNKYFICVLENPLDEMNIAATLRNVSAFGVEKLYIVGGQSVKSFEVTRKSSRLTRMSVGANKWVYVKHFESVEECFEHLRKNLYTIAVTSSHDKAKNVSLYRETFTQKRLAIVFGNESKGVSNFAITNSDMCIEIPMSGIVESLNLGTSTGIVLSYISQQRLSYVFEHKKVRAKTQSQKKRILKQGPKPFELKNKS